MNRVEINGIIDTGQNVLANINKIAGSCQSFVTWDPTIGNWTAIVNKSVSGLPGSAAYNFDDSTIVGSINVSGSGVSDLYNSAKVTFANKEILGDTSERIVSIDQEDRFDRELDNQLNLNFDLINDPVQAELLAAIELKQSRIDQIVEFYTDFRAIGIKPGDVVTLTSDQYNFFNKYFRVIALEEIDTDDGGILLKVTASEYDSTVYSTSGLTREQVIRDSGIPPSTTNICVIESKGEAISSGVANSLATSAGLSNITREQTYGSTQIGVPLFQTESTGWSASQVSTVYGSGNVGNYLETTFVTYRPIKNCLLLFEAPQGDLVLTVDGSNRTYTALGLPSVVYVYSRPFNVDQNQGYGSYTLKTTRYMEWSSYFTAISLNTTQTEQFLIQIYPLNTYDLNATNPLLTFVSSSNYISNATGDYATLSVLAFLN